MASPDETEVNPFDTKALSPPREGAIPFAADENARIDQAGDSDRVVPSPVSKTGDDTITVVSTDRKGDFDDNAGRTKYKRLNHAAGPVYREPHVRDTRADGPSERPYLTSVKTQIKFGDDVPIKDRADPSAGEKVKDDVDLIWRSRDNGKGRGSISVPKSRRGSAAAPRLRQPSLSVPVSRRGSVIVPVSARGGSLALRLVFPLRDFGGNIINLFTHFPYWDMSFWSGISYTIGSILFVMDGAWGWGPLAFPSTAWPGEAKYAVPLGFFIGTLFYEIGALMAYFEAINDGSFAGSAMKKFLQGHELDQKALLDDKLHEFFGHMVPHLHHENGKQEKVEDMEDSEADWKNKDSVPSSQTPFPQRQRRSTVRRGGVDYGETEEGEAKEYVTWRWWPTWHRLRTHHIYELGYISCAIQLFGATLYGMCGIVILPGILDTLSEWQANAAYWIPQIVASVCFLTAGIGFTLVTQDKWYKPELGILGWWCGAWATVGSVGFLLCGALGPASYHSTGAAYQSGLSSMWGSAAYLTSSVLQWYEAVNKHEVSELLTERTEAKAAEVEQPKHDSFEAGAP